MSDAKATTQSTPKAATKDVSDSTFSTDPARTDPYSPSDETIDARRSAAEEAYQQSIEGKELPPSVEAEQAKAKRR